MLSHCGLCPLCANSRHSASLFDHLIGPGKQGSRYLQPKCFRGPKVDHELKFRRLHHWQVCRRPLAAKRACRSIDYTNALRLLLLIRQAPKTLTRTISSSLNIGMTLFALCPTK